MSGVGRIVLQKSKVVGLRIFRENTKREAIADSYNRPSFRSGDGQNMKSPAIFATKSANNGLSRCNEVGEIHLGRPENCSAHPFMPPWLLMNWATPWALGLNSSANRSALAHLLRILASTVRGSDVQKMTMANGSCILIAPGCLVAASA